MMLFLTLKDRNKVREKIHRDQQSLTWLVHFKLHQSLHHGRSSFYVLLGYVSVFLKDTSCRSSLHGNSLDVVNTFSSNLLCSAWAAWVASVELILQRGIPSEWAAISFFSRVPHVVPRIKASQLLFNWVQLLFLYSVARQTIQVSLLLFNFSWWDSDTNICMSQTV